MRRPWIAWLGLLLVASCGFLPEDDFTGARIGDGIAPWTDLGPAPACLGNQFLGPPTSTPGGFCFDRNRIESPCLDDSDCASREACSCGRCTIPYCTTASDCERGRVCTFSDNRCDVACANATDCAAGEECLNGACRGRCERSDECQTGEVCNVRNVCVTAECADNGDCQSSESCHVQRVPRLVTEPFAIASPDEPQVLLYVEIGDDALPMRSIWRAISRDGIRFELSPAQPVLEDNAAAHAPSLVRSDTDWWMYYQFGDGAAIKVATSDDGIHFSPGVVVLTGGAGPSAVRSPSAVRLPDGSVAVYYQVGDGAAIGLATGAPGEQLTVRGAVLTPAQITVAPTTADAPFWAEVSRVTSPHAAVTQGPDGPSLRIWYSAFGRESASSYQFGMDVPIPPNFSIGYAHASIDQPAELTPWPYGPVADRIDAFLTHREEFAPAVVQLVDEQGSDAAYLMYYVEATATNEAMGVDGPFTTGRIGVLGNGAYSIHTGD